MTNVFSSVLSCLVIELKGKWSIWQRRRFHSTTSVSSTLCHYSASSPILFNLHSYIVCERGRERKKGVFFTHKYPFLAIHAKGGESISPKQKDRTTTNFKNVEIISPKQKDRTTTNFKNVVSQIWVKKRFFNWYLIFDIISNWYTLFKINI
jgi:hypothetical protein